MTTLQVGLVNIGSLQLHETLSSRCHTLSTHWHVRLTLLLPHTNTTTISCKQYQMLAPAAR